MNHSTTPAKRFVPTDRRGLSLLEVVVTIALFCTLVAFIAPRLTSTTKSSADAQAKSSLSTALDAALTVRATALTFSARSGDLSAIAPQLSFVDSNPSASTTQVSVSTGTASPRGVSGQSMGFAVLADGTTCWLALATSDEIIYAVSDANSACSASRALAIQVTSASTGRGGSLDRPIEL